MKRKIEEKERKFLMAYSKLEIKRCIKVRCHASSRSAYQKKRTEGPKKDPRPQNPKEDPITENPKEAPLTEDPAEDQFPNDPKEDPITGDPRKYSIIRKKR